MSNIDIADIGDLLPDPKNARKHGPRNKQAIKESLQATGPGRSIVIDENDQILAGNGVSEVARELGIERVVIVDGDRDTIIAVRRSDLTPEEKVALALYDNRAGELAEWDAAVLEEIAADDTELMARLFDKKEWAHLMNQVEREPVEDPGADISKAEELREKWDVHLGQLWQVGEHRIICGDCTDPAVVARVMGGEKANLLHADPPYGMGKEKEGNENDNLYQDKLDKFQMAWWRACRPHVTDNGSVYIWGEAESLWRLWYKSLKDSERLTFRNEIVWNKKSGQGMGSEAHRMYPTASERCLFFVIGEQGWNNNADNYWDGFTPIVEYLEAERQKAGWSIKDTKRIAGHSEKSGCHWFDKSQWNMPTEEIYNAWQAAAKGAAFRRKYDDLRRKYDDLRREWYATRAPFNNTHDLMTDVWNFDIPLGGDRPDHPTPKPVAAIARIVQTSGTAELPTLDPFLGSGTTIVAAQNLGRRGRGIELSPAYVAVALQRLSDMGLTPVMLAIE